MKFFSIAVFVVIAAGLLSFVNPDPNPLLGRWDWKSAKGDETFTIIARADSSIDGLLNGKAFVTGRYFVNGDTVSISDPICNADYWGSYRMRFHQDSVTFSKLIDSCQGRVEGLDGFTFVRVKKPVHK